MSSLTEKYSKWDNIELSDDESDCHPNIDKDSWFRMKHRSRVEREEKEESEKEQIMKQMSADLKKCLTLKTRLAEAKAAAASGGDDDGDAEDPAAVQAELSEVEKTQEKRQARLDELEKNKKWNWENMCHVVEERTVVSDVKDTFERSELPPKLAEAIGQKPKPQPTTKQGEAMVGPTSTPDAVRKYGDFVTENETLLEEYSEVESLEATATFLLEKGGTLFADHAQSYLLLACLEDEMNGKRERMQLVARQSQILTHITELAISLKRPPQDVVVPFFRRIKEKDHCDQFWEAVKSFAERVQGRAIEKRKEMEAERAARGGGDEDQGEELSREERLGPGGLDPIEVFETLPPALQNAYESRDTSRLIEAMGSMEPSEARHWIKQMTDSGLWVPAAGDAEEEAKEAGTEAVAVDGEGSSTGPSEQAPEPEG